MTRKRLRRSGQGQRPEPAIPHAPPLPRSLGHHSHPVHLCPGYCRARLGRRPCTQFFKAEASAMRRQCSSSCYENLRQKRQKSFGWRRAVSCSRAQQTSCPPWAGLWVPSRRPGSALKALVRGVYPRHWLLRRLARTALSPSPGPRGSLAFEKGLSLCSGSLPTPAPPQLHFLSCFPGILTAAPRGGQEAQDRPLPPLCR